MNSAKKLIQLGQLGTRHIYMSQTCRSTEKNVANYANLKAKQTKFQVDDGRLIHIKGGLVDRLLYQVTAVFCVIGLGISGKVLFNLSVPKKA